MTTIRDIREQDRKAFKELEEGDFFEDGEYIYMKIPPIDNLIGGSRDANALSLECLGPRINKVSNIRYHAFDDLCMVFPILATIELDFDC